MGKYETSSQEEFIPARKFKRVSSSDSLSTLYDFEEVNLQRIIPPQTKVKFIELITKRNYSMKEAAKLVQMSYSTAKKIYGKFRKQNMEKPKIEEGTVRAAYLQVPSGEGHKISICCLIAGNFEK